jgi:bacillithiol synthase
MKGLANLKKKLLRAEKRKAIALVNQIEGIERKLFPNGQLQERYSNWIDFYLAYGSEFIDSLIENSDFLDFKFSVLEEK